MKFIIIKRHLILVIGFLSLFITVISSFVRRAFDLQYDDGGIGTILILGKPIYGFVFWMTAEVLDDLEKVVDVPSGKTMVYIIGMTIFFLLDFLLNWFISLCRRGKKKNEK